MRQTVTLEPGWNAVYLEVQPEPMACGELFEGTPVRSVWAWNNQAPPVQYVRNPEELLPDLPEWFTYLAPSHPESFLSNLHGLMGGAPYMIELGGDVPFVMEFHGERVYRPNEWIGDSFNLVGFAVNPENPPSFARYFEASKAHRDQPVYRLGAGGEWAPVDASSLIEPGMAYWVYCDGPSEYQGPLSVDLPGSLGLDFTTVIDDLSLGLVNHTGYEKTVTLRPHAGLRPSTRIRDAEGELPESAEALLEAGEGGAKSAADAPSVVKAPKVPLSYLKADPVAKTIEWTALDGAITVTVPAHGSHDVGLAVRRAQMRSQSGPNTRYQSALVVEDSDGVRYVLPLAAATGDSLGGLWVGSAFLNKVSEASNADDNTTPTVTDSQMSFRLIVHVDDNNQATLLQNVTLMQVQPTYTEDPDNPGQEIIDTPGRYVILTRDDLIPQFEGVSRRDDGTLVGRRISSPVFSFRDPQTMTGSFPGTKLSLNLEVGYDDPLNPFVHRYHPDHDNLDERYEISLSEGNESYTFSRDLEFEFTDADPAGVPTPGWGESVVGGIYRETVSGVHKNDIYVEGIFRLEHVAGITELNDGIEDQAK